MPVRIIQLLCPQRHCVFAVAHDSRDMTDEEALAVARAQWAELTESRTLSPWCGICLSRVLRFEVGQTRFQSMPEAAPFLAACQLEQLISAEVIKARQAEEN